MRISTNLDMLRAIAVLYVVLDHSLQFFGHRFLLGVDVQWLGRLGVMFFFVHTCTVLMMSLDRSYGQLTTGRFIGSFYIRRIFRIYPLSIFSIAVVLIFSIPSAEIRSAYSFSQFTPTKTELLLNVLLMQNLHGRSIIGVLWSLPFEVQMYVILPFLFLFIVRKGRLASLLSIWILTWAVAYLIRPHNLFFLAHFLPGVMAYIILSRVRTPRIPGLVWPLFISCLTISFLILHPSFLTGGFFCLILGVALPFFQDIRFSFVNIMTHNIAKYSYGIYLSHRFCLWLAFVHFQPQSAILRSIVFISLLAGTPVLLFHILEDPCIRAGAVFADRLFIGGNKRKKETILDLRAEELEETASGL